MIRIVSTKVQLVDMFAYGTGAPCAGAPGRHRRRLHGQEDRAA